VLEALAIGRPVITTDAPGCRETVENGVNGFLVPIASASAVANAMRCFLKEPELVAHMAEASLLTARTKYDVRLVNKKMLQIMGL
jgi:glycosyltransferase involved in cell wall biosynthesis